MSVATSGGITKPADLSPNFLVNAIGAVFVFGLGVFTALMAISKEGMGFNPVILAGAMLSFVLLVGIETVLVWLLLKGRRGAEGAVITKRVKKHTTNELLETQPRELTEAAPSITEHTTRSFDPILREENSK